MTTLDGKVVRLAGLRGKTVLIDFWATWCVPCVAELPHMANLYAEFGSRKDFAMIGISLDEDLDALRDFVKKRKMTWPQVAGEDGGAAVAAERFGVVGIPAVFIIAPDQTVAAKDVYGKELVKTVERVLKGQELR